MELCELRRSHFCTYRIRCFCIKFLYIKFLLHQVPGVNYFTRLLRVVVMSQSQADSFALREAGSFTSFLYNFLCETTLLPFRVPACIPAFTVALVSSPDHSAHGWGTRLPRPHTLVRPEARTGWAAQHAQDYQRYLLQRIGKLLTLAYCIARSLGPDSTATKCKWKSLNQI